MTTYTEARDAIITHFSTNWATQYPTIPVVYDNTNTVDLDTVGNVFLRTTFALEDASQASIGDSPMQRVRGHLYISIFSRAGTGTRSGIGYLDYISTLFKFKNLSGVTVGAPSPTFKESHDGWHMQMIGIPFFFHVF